MKRPIELEWNRDASGLLVMATLGAFIGTAVLLLMLFVDL